MIWKKDAHDGPFLLDDPWLMTNVGVRSGVVAQLVERLVRNEKVRGSNPLGSTILSHKEFPLLPVQV